MTQPVTYFKDSNGEEMVKMPAKKFLTIQSKIKKLEATLKVSKGLKKSIQQIKNGQTSPIENLFKK